MTNVFKYDFAPTRAPPIGLPNLNLPGSFNFDFGPMAFDIMSTINNINWLDILILGFAAYGGMILIPRGFHLATSWARKFIKF